MECVMEKILEYTVMHSNVLYEHCTMQKNNALYTALAFKFQIWICDNGAVKEHCMNFMTQMKE